MIHRAIGIALSLLLISTSAFAGSYILPSDEELVRRADAIGTFTVTAANSYYGADGLIYTRYSLSTGERIKGELASASTYVTEMGGVVGSRMFSVSTSPAYAPGERVLVFLARRGDTWSTLDGQMGKFTFARGPDGSEILVRDQDAFAILTHASEPATNGETRDAATMLELIRRLAAETPDEPVRQLAISPMLVQPDDAGANTAFNTARGAWNGDAGSNINIGNGGTAASLSYGNSNDENVVHFGVPSSFCYGSPQSCPLSGNVVGQAQLWATSTKNTLRGEEFYTALECDVIVEAGLTGNVLNEVTAHELGHCLGYRHSNQGTPSSSNALMNSTVSGVGANLRSWDRDAANVVYGDGTAAPGETGNAYLTQFGSPLNGGARWPSAGFSMKVHGDAAPVCSAPAITTQPQNRTISSGQTASLSVSATGTSLSYQWYSGGSPSTGTAIPGATSASFTTPPLTTTQTYSVRVSNECGSVNSSVATVTVGACVAPSITTQPQNRSISAGQTAALSVAASGTSPFTYQWFSGGTPSTGSVIPGATGATFTTPALSATQTYSVRVTNSCGNASSNIATVTVEPCNPPAITTNPLSATVQSGQSANLSVTATGSFPRTIQWYRGASGNTSNPIAGATAATLNTGPLTATSQFWVRVANGCGAANSATATVTVQASCVPPAITTPPQGASILSGAQATLHVVATGTSLQFQWFRGASGDQSTPVTGETGSSFTTPPLTSTQSYWVRVSNSCGTVSSPSAVVSVGCDLAIVSIPDRVRVPRATSATVTVVATGAGPLVYQWYTGSSGDTSSPIGGPSGATLGTGPITRTIEVWVRVTSPCGVVDSESVRISVKRARAARRG